jgi:DNA modification methylase/predicted RNA-binding Zn-ribbon protein involved in translation (DUF1610 family)
MYNSDNEPDLFPEEKKEQPEICLGRAFNSSEERREYYRNLLREKLKDPEFRAIEGFPLGKDEDIVALSDPPYYCACPNPWTQEIIAEWESQKEQPLVPYKREPFASDVSEGKNDPIYNAHTYHTKVPHKAIMRYILHYTEPGDIVFDGFCGTGMTGVAAQLCGDKRVVESLGYQVNTRNEILRKETDDNGKEIWKVFSHLGARKAVLNDLSPAASFIAYNYNSPTNADAFNKEAERILKEVEKEFGWMYETKTSNGATGKINYTVWSDVFICPECGQEVVFYNEAVNKETGSVQDSFPCPHCHTTLTKRIMKRATETSFDPAINETITMTKQVPVLINYTYAGKRGEKKPDAEDLALIEQINKREIPYWFPTNAIPDGDKTSDATKVGITRVHQFYTKRNLTVLAAMRNKSRLLSTKFWLDSLDHGLGKRVKHGNYSFPMSTLSGTLYIPSVSRENNPLYFYRTRAKKLFMVFNSLSSQYGLTSVNSTTDEKVNTNTIDYLFLDPPFGGNLMYSELSFAIEAWLRVLTDNTEEAIENTTQKKGIFEYRVLMQRCFAEAYRVLKPGRWCTIEFSNTDAKVWNSIQTSLSEVGFIVANVSALDKQQGSFNAVSSATAVKQDLVISCYKPDELFERQVVSAVGEEAVWNFVRKHLDYLPLVKHQGEATITVPERDPRIIYDRMLSYFVGHNMLIPISSPDFLREITKRFAERDGLYYLQDQVQEYDKLVTRQQIQAKNEDVSLFVTDEASAIGWIRLQLKYKPMTLGEMTPIFMQQLDSWNKNEKKLELRDLLEQNFLCYDGKEDVPAFIHGWLSTTYKELRNLPKSDPSLRDKAKGRWYIPDPNKASDLEKVREKSLLKDFDVYRASKGKLKEFRIEAIRAGFKKAWQDKDYELIKTICERMPSDRVEEDDKLLMWYNGALVRLGE